MVIIKGYLFENRAADPRPSASHLLPPSRDDVNLLLSTRIIKLADFDDPNFLVSDALSYSLGLVLCGPYDIINGKLDSNNSSTANENDDKKHTKYHLHSKFYYDPPEFMTVIKETEFKTGFHIGYYR